MALDLSTTARLMEAIKGIAGEASRSTRTVPAVCTRVDGDGTAWVRAVGSSEDTPIDGASTSVVEAGDMVNVDVSDGTATIVGNMTSPSVGSVQLGRVTESVKRMGSSLMGSIDVTSGIAGAAERVAKAINQHFWTDDSGIHVTQVTQEEWQTENSGPNVLINSLGQLFRDGLNNLLSLLPAQTQTDTFTGDGTTTAFTLSETPASITRVTVGGTATAYSVSGTTLTLTTAPVSDSEVVVAYKVSETAIAIWDGMGNAASNILASFGEVVRIGRSTSAHIEQSGTKTMFYIAALAKPILSIGGNGSGRIGRIDFYDSESSITGNESQIYIGSSGASDSKSVSIESNYTGGSTSKGSHVIASAGSSGSDVTISAYGTGNGVQVVFDSKDGVAIRNNKQTIHNSSGDSTVSGNVVTVESTSNSNPVSLLASSSSSNRGLYDNVSSQWIVRAGSNNDVYLNGHNVSDVEDHKFFAAPSGGGDAYFREIWASDIPNGMAASKITSSGPTNLTLNSASQAYSSGKTPKYCKWGNVVSVYGAVSPKTQVDAGGTLAIGTLPSGYRPPMDMEWLCQGSGNSVWLLSITTAGVLTASRYRNGASANAAMPTNTWLTFSATFLV